jgi:hypothetical protein
MIQPIYKPDKKLEIYARFRQQTRQKNERNSTELITPIEDVVQRNYRLNLSYAVSELITLKSRVEWITVDRKSVGQENFDWVVETADTYAIERAKEQKADKDNLTWGEYVKRSAAGKKLY